MQSLNKNKIAYLGSLTLLFSYAEMLLPKILPFFRFGFGNIAILLALDLNPLSFLILVFIKSFASSFISGTLFSPFFLISLGQAFSSGFGMYLLWRIKGKCLSIYGISLVGGALSCVTQIYLAAFYIGQGTYSLFSPMLIFSIIASIITATISQKLSIPENPPLLVQNNISKTESVYKSLLLIFSVVISSALIFMNNNIYFLLLCMLLCFASEIASGRKLLLLPHLFMWIFIIISSLFVPQGKVLYSIGKLSITQDAFVNAVIKAVKLSSVMALSQCCTNITLKKLSIFSLTFSYFNGLVRILKNTQGNIVKKLTETLQATELKDDFCAAKKIKLVFPVLILILTVSFTVYTKIF